MSYTDIDKEIREKLPRATDDEVSSVALYVKKEIVKAFQDGLVAGRVSKQEE